MKFLATPRNSFAPHAAFGVVPEDILDKFGRDKADTFSSASKLISRMKSEDRSLQAEKSVQRMNAFRGTFGLDVDSSKPQKHKIID